MLMVFVEAQKVSVLKLGNAASKTGVWGVEMGQNLDIDFNN